MIAEPAPTARFAPNSTLPEPLQPMHAPDTFKLAALRPYCALPSGLACAHSASRLAPSCQIGASASADRVSGISSAFLQVCLAAVRLRDLPAAVDGGLSPLGIQGRSPPTRHGRGLAVLRQRQKAQVGRRSVAAAGFLRCLLRLAGIGVDSKINRGSLDFMS